jgi:predicted transcriptional regulator
MPNLETELSALKARVDRLEAVMRRLTRKEQQGALSDLDGSLNQKSLIAEGEATSIAGQFVSQESGDSMDQEQLLAWLKAERLVVEPPSLAHTYAERWQAMPEEQKQAVHQELDHLPPGPMASDIIIENRH